MPTISGRVAGQLDQRMAERRGRVRCPSAAIEAIIAEVVSRGLFGDGLIVRSLMLRPPASSAVDRELPLVRLDADEVVLLARLQERHAPAHLRVGR